MDGAIDDARRDFSLGANIDDMDGVLVGMQKIGVHFLEVVIAVHVSTSIKILEFANIHKADCIINSLTTPVPARVVGSSPPKPIGTPLQCRDYLRLSTKP
jgi:hypothetical protein